MQHMTRRKFVGTVGAAAGTAVMPFAPVLAAAVPDADRTVHLSGDGISITPRAYAALLDQLCQQTEIAEDNYLLGGEVERFERHWAALLGKEAAVFMPSGTLANQLALRALAGTGAASSCRR